MSPNEQGSTIGISIVRAPEEMAPAVQLAARHDPCVLIEQFVAGTEITAAVLGNRELQVLPLVEIVPEGGFYDYERKYTPGATEEIVPARIPPAAAARAEELALRAHRALQCRGMSRVDMIVGEDGVTVLEVNTIPGMTPTSLLPRAAAAAGIPFSRLVDRLIELALEDRAPRPAPCAR
jgi:D-alanine-D-alanine ligase